MANEIGVTFEDGKYTVQGNQVLRHGEPWRDITGDKFIGALLHELEESRRTIERLHEEENQSQLHLERASRKIALLQEKIDAHENQVSVGELMWDAQTLKHYIQYTTPIQLFPEGAKLFFAAGAKEPSDVNVRLLREMRYIAGISTGQIKRVADQALSNIDEKLDSTVAIVAKVSAFTNAAGLYESTVLSDIPLTIDGELFVR